jgi:pyruvate dehydrogenase phosphatase
MNPTSNEDVVSLVGGHLAGLKGTIPKSDLPSLVPTSAGSLGVEGKDKRKKATAGSWAFVDDNVSAHLIRNAFRGGDEMALRRLLSIPAPHSRRYRDDVTVTVVWWEDGKEEGAQMTSFTDKAKSKL